MARSQQHHVEAQIQALVDIFIQGITPREALELLDRGPSALAGACFSWAFRASNQIEGVPAIDATSSASLHEHAPLVARLRELASEAFIERFGEPRTPRLPKRPDGLTARVNLVQDPDEHSRISRSARILCHTVVYSVCMSWQSWYFLTRSRDRREFKLWVRWEDGESYSCFTTPAAWLEARQGVSERDAALFLLEDYWTAMEAEWGRSRPNERNALGRTLTQDELDLVVDRVWPPT